MRPPFASHKIRSEHLARLALIYIRQSTLVQVLENVGSPVLSVQDSARRANTTSSNTLSTWVGRKHRSWLSTKTRGYLVPPPLNGTDSSS